jgi:hypothetical protein
MSKGAGRKTFERGASTKGASTAVDALSPEDAERAAASFVPLWEFDEASFEVGGKVSDDDLNTLAAPVAAVLVPSALLRAAPEEPPPRSSGRHTPLPPRPDDPLLPSVVIAGEEPAANGAPEPIPLVSLPQAPAPAVILAPAIATAAVPAPPSVAKAQPKAIQALPAPRPSLTSDAILYPMPRRRGPVLAAVAVVGSAAIVMAIYFVSTAMSAPAPVSVTPAATHSPEPPKVNIPPPPPPDEAPAAGTSSPNVGAARATSPVVPTPASSPVSPISPAPRTVVSSPPVPAVAHPVATPRPPTRPAAGKNPSPPPHPGDIVRDNPF